MNEQIQEMMEVATGILNGVFITSGKPEVTFKKAVELERGGDKNLLIVGSVHRQFDDGFCIAVLNPDEELTAKLNPGLGIAAPMLKKVVTGHCTAMVHVQCTAKKTYLASKYRSRMP